MKTRNAKGAILGLAVLGLFWSSCASEGFSGDGATSGSAGAAGMAGEGGSCNGDCGNDGGDGGDGAGLGGDGGSRTGGPSGDAGETGDEGDGGSTAAGGTEGEGGTGNGAECEGAEDGAPCGGRLDICVDEVCAETFCGDGFVDELTGEECDDANETPHDGCETSCEPSCTPESDDCDDGDPCNGVESCGEDFACTSTEPLDCDDENPCTADSCDAVLGCRSELIDGDGDGQAPTSLGVCGTDCNDDDPAVHDGAADFCDGVDNDCDESIDEDGTATWWQDCDDDGYASLGAATRESCTKPTEATSCAGGDWVTVNPATSDDCNDGNAAIRPGATEVVGDQIDQDCNGQETCYRDADNDGVRVATTVVSTDTDCADSGEARNNEPSGNCSGNTCDCNDNNATIRPGATEVCNNVDDDCVGGVDNGLTRPTAPDNEEDNSQWFLPPANQAGGPTLPTGTTGSSSVVSPPGTVTFHAGDGIDHYTWDRSFSTWNPSYQPYWMCRVTGLRPDQTVLVRVGAWRPGGNWTATLCGSPTTMSCFSHIGQCASLGDGGTCRTSQITNPSAGSDQYGFGVSITPLNGWNSCDVDYEVECKLTESTSW